MGDHQYGTNENYRRCVKRGIRCHLGDVKSSVGGQKEKLFSRKDFDYEAGSDRYRCPAGYYLKRYRTQQLEAEGFADYRMKGKLCQQCVLKPQCTSSKHGRRLKVPLELEWVEMGRAQSWSPPAYQDRRRRKHLMEGSFGDATNCHHFKQARWRGLQKQSIQDLLIAVCQNVRILCRHSFLPLAQQRFESTRHENQCFPTLQHRFWSLIRLFWTPMGWQLSKMTRIPFSVTSIRG